MRGTSRDSAVFRTAPLAPGNDGERDAEGYQSAKDSCCRIYASFISGTQQIAVLRVTLNS